jgi:hypothetical protein
MERKQQGRVQGSISEPPSVRIVHGGKGEALA